MVGLGLGAALLAGAAAAPRGPLRRTPIADDPTGLGPYAVQAQEYHLDAEVDELVLPDRSIEYWAVVWSPVGAAEEARLPLEVFLHGNHATCGTGSNPRIDSNSQYTMTGTCPPGFIPVPQHRGYDYIAERLASHGHVVVSLNANRGINSGSGVEGDARLIKARGALILGHLALLAGWERGEPSPLEDPLPLIDWGRLGIFGHSRGGEAARAAHQFIVDPAYWSSQPLLDRLGPDVAAELRVLAILEIGAVDYNGRETNLDERTFDAPGAAWVAIVPTCDGDVSHLAGVRPADRLLYAGPDTAGWSATLFAWVNRHEDWPVASAFHRA